MSRPFFQIQFLLHSRFPHYTDRVVEIVNRIVHEVGDQDLRDDQTLQAIADALGPLISERLIRASPGSDHAGPRTKGIEAGQLTAEGRDRLRAYLDAARDFSDSLYGMPDDEFWALYCDERKKEDAKRQAIGEKRDCFAFFNEPNAKPDYEHWRRAERWTPEEAVALSLEKEPTVVNTASLKPLLPPSPFRDEYARRLLLVQRAIVAGKFTHDIKPALFLNWARDCGMTYPLELDGLRGEGGIDAEGDDQIFGNRKVRSPDQKARNSLLRLLIAVAAKQYNLDSLSEPQPQISNSIVGLVQSDLARLKLRTMSDKIISDWLRDAVTLARADNSRSVRPRERS